MTEEELQRQQAKERLAGNGLAQVNISGISDTTDKALAELNKGYQQGQQVTQAQQQLQNIVQNKPADYQSNYKDQLQGLYDKIMNRGAFNYDPTADQLYRNYREQYTRNGQQAMRDTTAGAAAMTGGYGNSYAQAAGNQAYQGYMQQLNDRVPELYDRAYQRWQDEGAENYNRYALANQAENQDYSRYGDQYNQWLGERDYYTGRYDTEYANDYGRFANDRNYWMNIADRENNEQALQQELSDAAFNRVVAMLQTGTMPSEQLLIQAGLTPEQAKQMLSSLYKGSSGGSGSGGKKDENGEEDLLHKLAYGAISGASAFAANAANGTQAKKNVTQTPATEALAQEINSRTAGAGTGSGTIGNSIYDAWLESQKKK